MTRPTRYLLWMAVGVVAAIGLAAVLFGRLASAFHYNPGLNAVILAVLLLGICYTFWQVLRLNREIEWLDRFRTGQPTGTVEPRLLAPMAAMLGERRGRFSLSALSLRSLLDGLQARLLESYDLSRYLIGLLVFLGLLGTFWGLLGTIGAVANAISGISLGSGGDVGVVFDQLKSNLQGPLTGMGTAFSSSLFGLAGSLLVGFLELQASQAQNRFFNEVEDWLSGQTRLSSGGPVTDGEQSVPVYIQALLEQTAESLDNLQRTMGHAEEGRVQGNQRLQMLVERLTLLTDQMRAEQQLMIKVAESQNSLQSLLQRMYDQQASGQAGLDEGSRQHLRNLDIQLGRLVEESVTGRQHAVAELKSEIKLLTRTIAAIAEGETPQVR